MAKVNAINNESEELTIDPGASGDSFIQLDINATNEFIMGVDDDDSDAFKISSGSTLGTTDSMVITAAGEITKPRQPAFHAYLPSTVNNVSGTGTVWTFGTSTSFTEVFDVNSDLSNATFTAPVTGRYAFFAACKLTDCSALSDLEIRTAVSNRDINGKMNSRTGTSADYGAQMCCLADMDAADTANFRISAYGEASNRNDIVGGASTTWIGGYLLC